MTTTTETAAARAWWLLRDRPRVWVTGLYFRMTPVRGELDRLRQRVDELERQTGISER